MEKLFQFTSLLEIHLGLSLYGSMGIAGAILCLLARPRKNKSQTSSGFSSWEKSIAKKQEKDR